MKIGLVCPYNMFRGGGVQECVRAVQAELLARGHDTYIVTPMPRKAPDESPEKMIFIGGATDVKSPFHTTAQISFTANTDALHSLQEEYQFDILHFHEPWVPIMSRQLLARSTSINVATFHAKLPDTMMSKTIERVITPYTKSVLKYLDSLTAVSEAAAQYVRELTDEPITLIPNGIDLGKFKRDSSITRPSKQPPTILYVGRLEKRKGVKYLLQALQFVQAANPDVQLLIAGDGPDRQKLEQLTVQLGLKNVKFLGFIAEEKKLELLQTADVFCSPALYGESFGIVLLEAMAFGTPIVAGDNPGYSSVLRDTGKVSLVNPRYSEEFGRRLEILLFDASIRDAWIKWSKKYIKQFDYKIIVDQYEALYTSLCKKRKN